MLSLDPSTSVVLIFFSVLSLLVCKSWLLAIQLDDDDDDDDDIFCDDDDDNDDEMDV